MFTTGTCDTDTTRMIDTYGACHAAYEMLRKDPNFYLPSNVDKRRPYWAGEYPYGAGGYPLAPGGCIFIYGAVYFNPVLSSKKTCDEKGCICRAIAAGVPPTDPYPFPETLCR